MKNKFPIYVISKGRWSRRQTVKTLLSMKGDFKVCVEPKEYEKYANVIDEKYLIKLPENFSELGYGSIPVRNWVWNNSIKNGDDFHWILDDNLEGVYRYNKNQKIKCFTMTPFRVIEDFVLRYKNISIAGMHYDNFCPADEARPPIQLNNRVYSCILIKNNTSYRWRGKYNEDTDLCLRMLKDGWCSVLFRQFLVGKRCTMAQSGGNTDTIYDTGDKRLAFAESLAKQHPDVVKVIWRFNRWHHLVNYKPFKKNKLIFADGIKIKNNINEYDFKLIIPDNYKKL